MPNFSGFKLLLTIILVLTLVPSAAWSQPEPGEQNVQGIGAGRINAKDVAAGRQEAVNAALMMAVSRALSDLISPEAMVGQFQVINETILNRTDQYVRDYKVLADATMAGTYRVVVQATVLVGRLKETLRGAGIRLGKVPYPRVLVCVAERRAGEIAPQYWWSGRTALVENVSSVTLSQALAAAGFVIVEPGLGVSAGSYSAELSAAEAIALGRQFQAEVVVVGAASAEEVASAGQAANYSYNASLNTRAYRLSDGQQIAQSQQAFAAAAPEKVAGGREALHGAAAKAGDELSAQIGGAWFKQAAVGTRLEIVVKGVGGKIANFVKFRGVLSTVSGVENLLLKTMMPDQAILTLNYKGTAQALADALVPLAYDGFTVTIEAVEAETIRLKLVSR
jgi:hypothetical protein